MGKEKETEGMGKETQRKRETEMGRKGRRRDNQDVSKRRQRGRKS